jgi:hypothetical protein
LQNVSAPEDNGLHRAGRIMANRQGKNLNRELGGKARAWPGWQPHRARDRVSGRHC